MATTEFSYLAGPIGTLLGAVIALIAVYLSKKKEETAARNNRQRDRLERCFDLCLIIQRESAALFLSMYTSRVAPNVGPDPMPIPKHEGPKSHTVELQSIIKMYAHDLEPLADKIAMAHNGFIFQYGTNLILIKRAKELANFERLRELSEEVEQATQKLQEEIIKRARKLA